MQPNQDQKTLAKRLAMIVSALEDARWLDSHEEVSPDIWTPIARLAGIDPCPDLRKEVTRELRQRRGAAVA